MSEQNFRVITAAAAVTQAVMPLQRQSQQEKQSRCQCPVGGEPVAEKIAAIMGAEVGDS